MMNILICKSHINKSQNYTPPSPAYVFICFSIYTI